MESDGMEPTEKKQGSKKDAKKRVVHVLKAFKSLSEEGAEEDRLFQRIKSLYGALDEYEKGELFRTLMEEIEVSKEKIGHLLETLSQCGADDPKWLKLLSKLRSRARSPRLNIFRKISRSPGGLKFLLDFRGDLLSVQRFSKTDLSPLDADIILFFEVWFQDGFLYLEEITLDSSYRQIELIKNSDLVHPMTNIEEMGQRLGEDRRCFALYHRLIPYEPIIFIEVALTAGMIRHIAEIIEMDTDRTPKAEADTAIFYSINNTQNGLAGLGLGKMLIGQVVNYLRKENEEIKNFATLSPLPGFWGNYFKPILEGKDESFALRREEVPSYFAKKQLGRIMESAGVKRGRTRALTRALLSILSNEEWTKDEELRKILHQPLVKIAYHYISEEKNPQNRPLNPVTNFHLANGATVSQKDVNFLANPSNKGLKESCGIMVNYVYTSSWLSQIRRSFKWFDRLEVRGIFSRR
jgi:malonyl-CoA decarboxylase